MAVKKSVPAGSARTRAKRRAKRPEPSRRDAEDALRRLNAELARRVAEQTSELQRSYEIAQAERQRLYDVLETLPVYVVLLTPDYHVPFANRFFEERFGRSGGQRCFEYLFHRTEPCEKCETYKVLKTGAPHHWEWTGPDGRNYDIYDFPFTDTDGSPLILEMGIDITEIHKARTALEEINHTLEQRVAERTAKLAKANKRLRGEIDQRRKAQAALVEVKEDWERTFDTLPDLIAILDSRHRIVRVNRAMARTLGMEAEQCIGLPCFQCVHGTDRPPESCPHARTLRDGGEHTAELYEERLGGDFLVTTTPMFNASGELIGSVHVARDITERKRAEARIADLARFPEENPSPVLRARADGTLLYANDAAKVMLDAMGWLSGQKLPAILQEHVAQTVSSGARCEADIEVGDYVYSVAFSGSLGHTDVNLYVRDVTYRKQAEEVLRTSRADLNHAQAVGQIGSWRLDVQNNVLTWSDENHRIFGISKGTPMTYETFLGTVHPDDREYVHTKWNAGLRGEPYDIEHRIVVDGAIRWVREKAYLEFDDDGTLRGGFGITQDITQRKQAEEALRTLNETLEQRVAERTAVAERRARLLSRLAAKLSQVEHNERSRLAAILHDDLQQLLLAARLRLAGIGGHEKRLHREIEPVDQLLDECLSASRDLTMELSPPVLRRGTLGDVFKWLGAWFAEKHGLSVVVDAPEELPPTREHVRFVLFHAVRELLSNTVKHSGTMEASVLLLSEDGRLTIQVEDRGSGFDAEAVREKLERAHSFGLLNIRERLEALGGRLEFDRTPTGGACFCLIVPLPAMTEPTLQQGESVSAVIAPTAARKRRPKAGTIRLLVVDDHKVVREGFVGLLDREADFEVVGQAADGEEAVRQAEALRPDVVIMDVELPKLDGVEATRHIKRQQPGTLIVGLSLHEEESIARAMTEAGASVHLSKNRPAEDLIEAIRGACGRG